MDTCSLLEFEKKFWNDGCVRVAGVDEAGRGPLAGPVVAAAVVFDRTFLENEAEGILEGLTDSKRLTEKQRNVFFELLRGNPDVDTGVGIADVEEIDRINILKATHLAMARALENLAYPPEHVIIDGLPVPYIPFPSTAIVKGDSKSCSIAAASIVAKVTRDKMMVELDKSFPDYGFRGHKGYGTSAHIQALLKHGPTPEHRRSFRPVRETREIRDRSGNAAPPTDR